MKINIDTPFCKGELTVSKSQTKSGYHSVLVNLQMPVNRVGQFEDYGKAVESSRSFALAVGAGPFPCECELERVSSLLRFHLGIKPEEWEECEE